MSDVVPAEIGAPPEEPPRDEPARPPERWLSPEVRLLARPFAVYRELVAEDDPRPIRTVVSRTILQLVVISASIAFVSAGRLTARLFIGTSIAWAMVPLLEWTVVAITFALGRPAVRFALGLYMAGNAPLLLFLLACAAMCIFSPDVYATFTAALRSLVLPLLLFGSLFYGWALSYAYYRAALGFGRTKAMALLVVDVTAKIALVVGWYMAINNILPQVLGTER